MDIVLLKKILPEWEFRLTRGWLHFTTDGSWVRNHNTSDPWDADHLCGELERALRKDERVGRIVVEHMNGEPKGTRVTIYDHTVNILGWGVHGETLNAWLSAAAPLYQGGEE